MSTIINTPPAIESTDSGAGWAVAVILLLAVIATGAYAWFHYHGAPAARSTTIQLNLPGVPATSNTPTAPTQ